jgi:hypothetical protein
MLPTAAAWNVNASLEAEAREHESGHAAAAVLLGFVVGEISLDRWADFGELGRVSIRWAGTIGDPEELAFARAVVAAAGPLVTDAWELDRSRRDRSKVEEVRWPAWPSLAWEFVVTHKTERLVRSEAFRRLHQRVVAALEEVGEVGTLSGAELARALATPDAGFLPGAPRPSSVATSARRRGVHSAGKVADAVAEDP